MKYFTALLLSLVAFNLNAQQEEMEYFLSVQNVSPSEIPGFSVEDDCEEGGLFQMLNYNASKNGLQDNDLYQTHSTNNMLSAITSQNYSTSSSKSLSAAKSLKYYAYSVAINTSGGFTFHIADYYDGSRVVTCLDGEMVGTQGISVNGVKTLESTNVEWHKTYFVHRYPSGKITSHQNKQTAEIR